MDLLRFILGLYITIGLLSCEDPSSLIPLNDLPFEYQLELQLQGTNCAFAQSTIPRSQSFGTMNLGTQDQTVVALIKSDDMNWRLEGLRCIDEQKTSQALCLASKQSKSLQNISRAPGVRDEQDGLLSCMLFSYIPHTVPLSTDNLSTPSDPAWQSALGECCQTRTSNDQAIYLTIGDSSSIAGDLSIKHQLHIGLPTNGQPNALSSEESQGAIAACGGPISCVNYFYLSAKPAQ